MTASLSQLVFGLYATSLICYAIGLSKGRRMLDRLGTLLLALGIVAHYFALLQRARAVESVPYQDLYGSISLFSWLLAVTYLGVERFHRQRAVAPIVLPFVIVFFAVSSLLSPEQPPPPPPARGPLFALHVTLNVLAYAAFAVAFVMSCVYLAQNRILRARKLGALVWQFPALEELERMSRTSALVGVLALSCGIVLGMMWLHRLQGGYLTGDPKEIVSFLILIAYIIYLSLARTTAWRGARASWLCVFNFVLVVFSFTLVNLFLSGYHRYV